MYPSNGRKDLLNINCIIIHAEIYVCCKVGFQVVNT